MATKLKRTIKRPARNGNGWQAEKSAMTRRAILDAAIECFVELGYANTTTALIADYAGVSRGAMMHHFPSRHEVLKAAVQHLHEKRLEEYRALMADFDAPDAEAQLNKQTIRKAVDAAWKYVNLPSFAAYHELLVASRTDPELKAVMQPLEKQYESRFMETVRSVYPHWANLEVLELANDLVHFLLRGMAISYMSTHKQQRSRALLELLTDQLEQLYTQSTE